MEMFTEMFTYKIRDKHERLIAETSVRVAALAALKAIRAVTPTAKLSIELNIGRRREFYGYNVLVYDPIDNEYIIHCRCKDLATANTEAEKLESRDPMYWCEIEPCITYTSFHPYRPPKTLWETEDDDLPF